MYKIAKGSKDLAGDDYSHVKLLIDTAETLFKLNGGVPLDTPVFERTSVLLGKYGDEAETKLIYKLQDQGGEDLSLRYDLTVPFVRYCKENGVKKMRRYSIGKVYRRDQPSVSQGRLREFYQADFDIIGGKQEGMLAELTLLNIVCQFMTKMNLNYKILINDVRNLQSILETKLGIKEWRHITPIIDKLDKQSFTDLSAEFKSVDPSLDLVALQEALSSKEPYNPSTREDFLTLQATADAFGFADKLVFTNTLARGLDYYTGFIWEFKVDCMCSTVSAGGRYDSLLNNPAVGISIGISRLSTIIDWTKCLTPENSTCFVASVGNISIGDKLRVVKALQDRNTYSAVTYDLTPTPRTLKSMLSDAVKSGINYVAIIGEEEWSSGRIIKIKDLYNRTDDETIVIT